MRYAVLGSWTILAIVAIAGCGAERRPAGPTGPTGPDRSRALGIVLQAEDLRRPDLLTEDVLEHPEAAVRAAAFRALGRIGDPDSAAAVGSGLTDPGASVRAAAIVALARVDPGLAINRLATSAADKAKDVRAAAALVGGALDPGVAAPLVGPLLEDADPDVRIAAAASAAMVAPDRAVVERLAVLADDPATRMAAVIAIAEIARPGSAAGRGAEGFLTRRAARDRLLAIADDRSSAIRVEVARGLAIPASNEDTTALMTLANDRDSLVRIQAIRSLAYPGSPLAAIAKSRMDDTDPAVRLTLFEALAGVRSDRATQDLVVGVRDDRGIGWLVAGVLGPLYRAAPGGAMESAANLALHPAPEVRAAMCRALAEIPVFTAPAIHDVVRSMSIRDVPMVREAAIEALEAFGIAPTSFPDEVLASDDARDRTGLARAVGSWLRVSGRARPAERAIPVLESLDRRVPGDTSVRAQAALIDAASAALDDPTARAILEARANAGDPALRRRAQAALGDRSPAPTSGEPPADPRPYAEIAAWASEPRAAIVQVQRPGFAPGRFTMALDVGSAPLAAHAFARAVEAGRYDGVEFGGFVPGARIRAGDPGDPAFDHVDHLVRDEPFDGSMPPGSVLLEGIGPDLATGALTLTLAPRIPAAGPATRVGVVVQNFDGVVRLLRPGDRILGITIYEGDGSEPLPPIE